MPDLRSDIARALHAAFAGVVLGSGTSLSQAEIIDRWGRNADGSETSPKAYRDAAARDITDDWSRVTLADLERNNIAHFDAAGLRYYLPALLLSLLDRYDPCAMRVIGTLRALCPSGEGSLRAHVTERLALLDGRQKRAVARFLEALPTLVALDPEDETIVARALDRYWSAFLKD